MVSTQRVAVERRADSHAKLKTLLGTRKETLTLYSRLAGMRPYNVNGDTKHVLQEFCEALVDYTASAHFQLYRYIEEDAERRTGVKDLATKIYPDIAASTRFILDFNEKYDCEDHCDNLSNLDQELSRLGEVLADRITLEDQIISALSVSR